MKLAGVLIVDEDQETHQLLRELRDKTACPVYFSRSMEDALTTLDRHKIDVLVVAIPMSAGNGLVLIEQSKAIYSELKSIVLTLNNDKENLLKALHLGAVNHLQKPVEMEELLIHISRCQDQDQCKSKQLSNPLKDPYRHITSFFEIFGQVRHSKNPFFHNPFQRNIHDSIEIGLEVLGWRTMYADFQEATSKLLHLSLEDKSLRELMDDALTLFLDLPFLPLQKKGAIFLSNAEGNLFLLSSKGLPDDLKERCSSVAKGQCLCGGVALNGKPFFGNHNADLSDTISFPGMEPHRHYVVPLKWHDRVLGVVTCYVDADHSESQKEWEILKIFTNILAGIVYTKQSKAQLSYALKTLESEEKYIRSIMDSSLDAIITANRNGQILEYNPSAVILFGFSKEEAVDRNVVDLIVPELWKKAHEDGLRNAKGSLNKPREWVNTQGKCKDGTIIDLAVALIAVKGVYSQSCFADSERDLFSDLAITLPMQSQVLSDQNMFQRPKWMEKRTRYTAFLRKRSPT